MSKVLGIIAEYNPFHNGHLYHLDNSKKVTGANYTVAIIGGNFTERGDTSLINKWSKTEMALKSGIDLVIELPVLYSISSAENFAQGGIKLLNSLGIVDYISFGSETGNIKELDKVAHILYDEPEEYKKLLSQELDSGVSYPKARENSLQAFANIPSEILSSPNNILAIEYLKALKKYESIITPITVKRFNSDYTDKKYNEYIASATAIRELIKEEKFDKLKDVVPKNSYEIIIDQYKKGNIVSDISCFESEILYILRKLRTEEIAKFPDVSEGLEFSIKKVAYSCNNVESLIELIKSKRYTRTRIQRILLYALLNITKEDMEISKNTIPYARVLGFNKKGKEMLSNISKANPNLKIITSVKKFLDSNDDDNLNLILEKDILATNIYSLACATEYQANQDYTNKIKVCYD